MNAPVREGEVLAGKYRVDRVLGVGGMGVVVAAHHIELDDKVAIKFLLPETLGNPEAVTRFAREARAAVKIKSEHVARVSDVGKLENGAPYMVMEYLEGSDLSAWLERQGALPSEQAVEFILQACEAIAEAHTLGIVHRDLKPANLFVIRPPDGRLSVKVLDFGISKMTSLTGSGGEASMTRTSAMMGSPLYMSPEQMQSPKDVDARADIWALGIILYELVTGDTPFTGDSVPALVLQIMQAPPPPLRKGRPDAPDGLEAVILKCLDKDRSRRYESVGELALALLPFGPKRSKGSVERISGVMRAAGMSATAMVLPASSDREGPGAGAGTLATWGRTNFTGGRGRTKVATIAGVLVLGAVALTLVRKPTAPEEAPSASPPVAAMSAPGVIAAFESARPVPMKEAPPAKAAVAQTAPQPPNPPSVAFVPAPVPRSPRGPAKVAPPRPLAVVPAIKPVVPPPPVSANPATPPKKTSRPFDDRM